jgi:hypothetical protein
MNKLYIQGVVKIALIGRKTGLPLTFESQGKCTGSKTTLQDLLRSLILTVRQTVRFKDRQFPDSEIKISHE